MDDNTFTGLKHLSRFADSEERPFPGSFIGIGSIRIAVINKIGFRIRNRNPREGRNPKTGDTVQIPAKRVPFFKAGKELREMVDDQ